MPMLGRASEQDAIQFVLDNPSARLGSRTKDGVRRVVTDHTGEYLKTLRDRFLKIAIMGPPDDSIITPTIDPSPCVHRGSQRRTCCGRPDLWICRELRTDCVATSQDAKTLQKMVATEEASAIAVCETCTSRLAGPAKPEFVNLWPASPRTAAGDAPRVGFVSAAYMPIGGTETFHRSLLPRLKSFVDIAGFVATAFHGGDGALLQVSYATGIEAARQLMAHCDVVVVWGIHDIATLLPSRRPKVIAVHHSDLSSDWNNRSILNQLDVIDRVVCVNEETSRKFSTCGKPTDYIPNAIDPSRISPSGSQAELRSRFGIPSEAKIVLFGHRLSSEKRPHLAVRIARNLPSDWMMIIAGEGPEQDAVKEAAVGCDCVRIVGACDSLADWLSISDCFLSLSRFEGFGLAIGEAMAAGVPTVSTPAGIAIGLATTIASESSVDEWVEAIVIAKQLVRPEVVMERFSVRRMVSSWADVIVKTHQGTQA